MQINKVLELAAKQHRIHPPVIEIFSTDIDHREGVSKAGKDYSISKQIAYLHDPSQKYPRQFQIQVASKNSPFPVGFYVMDILPSLVFDNFGSLNIDGRDLKLFQVIDI